MNSIDLRSVSSQPGFVQPLRAGFNVAANQVVLLLFPILMDLWIWLGVHIHMRTTMDRALSEYEQVVAGSAEQVNMVLGMARELLVERFNLMGALRTFPVGIPSLLASRLPITTPLGAPFSIEVKTWLGGLAWFLGLSLIGLGLGTLYFQVLSQAALNGNFQWKAAFGNWLWAFGQVIALSIVWVVLAVGISLPFGCLLPFAYAGGASPLLGLIYLAVFAWLFVPLVFSAHGIFVNREKMTASLMKSVYLTRLTLPVTMVFLFLAFLASVGLNRLWMAPEEDSWLMVIGLIGHAFVANGLLSASFIYYKEADQWVQKITRHLLLQRLP